MIEPLSGFDPVEELAESFVARYRRGERPSLTEYMEKYPQFAEQIRELFPALVVMEELGSVGGETGLETATASDASPAPRQLGEYRILREVGRGGMAVVYEAVQESLGRHVALKVFPAQGQLNASNLERFRREARAAARLHHTNIVPVFGVGQHEGIHYYAMQFIQGQGLDQVLTELKRLRSQRIRPATPAKSTTGTESNGERNNAPRGLAIELLSGGLTRSAPGAARSESSPTEQPTSALPASGTAAGNDATCLSVSSRTELSAQTETQYYRSAALMGVQVAEALDYAHKQGVLHRDIKPSNLLLDARGTVWVSDFGLAKAEGSDELTQTGDIVGTLRYMAPERFGGWSDPRSDVYSLGMTLYELLTFRPAFSDSSRLRLIDRIGKENPVRPRKIDHRIPRDLETIVLKSVARESRDRYATAGALAEDLRRFLADRPIEARRSSVVEQAWRWCRRNPVVASLSGCVALLLLLITGISLASAVWLGRETQAARAAERDEKLQRGITLTQQAKARLMSREVGHRFETLAILQEAAKIFRELGEVRRICTRIAEPGGRRAGAARYEGRRAMGAGARLETCADL